MLLCMQGYVLLVIGAPGPHARGQACTIGSTATAVLYSSQQQTAQPSQKQLHVVSNAI
jgi:hypothetical protein